MAGQEKERTPDYLSNKNNDYHLVSTYFIPSNVYISRWVIFNLDSSENDITVSIIFGYNWDQSNDLANISGLGNGEAAATNPCVSVCFSIYRLPSDLYILFVTCQNRFLYIGMMSLSWQGRR